MALDINAFKSKRGSHTEVVQREIKATQLIEAFQAREFELLAEVDLGSAQKFGLRFGAGEAMTELAITNADLLQIGSVQTPGVRGREDKHFRLQIVAAAGKLLVQANNRVQYEKSLDLKKPCTVEIFAVGGTAMVRRVDLWEIRDEK